MVDQFKVEKQMEQQVQIQLINDNNEIIGYLDVKEGTVFPLTYSVSEIRDISKKKGTTSKSITLSGTKNNNILLNNYYDANIVAGTFDVNKLQIVNVIQNGISILDNAVMQLVSVNKSQENSNHEDNITYTVLIKDKTSDFFTSINNKYLTDLVGFDWMNHRYTAANVIASFNNTVENGYKYVMPYNPGAAPNLLNDTLFDLTEFTPGIYAKTYFDKIFSNAGFSYYWPDKDSEDIQFSKLIIPYNGDKPKITALESSQFNVDVYRTGTTVGTSTYGSQNISFGGTAAIVLKDSLPFQITFPFEYSDPSNLWNTSTSIYTTPQVPSTTNNLDFEYEVTYDVVVVNPGSTAWLKSYSTFNGNSSIFPLSIQPKVSIKKNTVSVYANDALGTVSLSTNASNSYPNGTTVVKSGITTIKKMIPTIDPDQAIKLEAILDINSSSSPYVYMFKSSNSAAMNGNNRENVTVQLRIKSMRLKVKTFVNGSYGYNVPVSMSRYIPEKIKQSDFVKSIFTMFNLYAEVDKQNPNRINIKGRNAYYDEGKFNDWTNKLVKEKDQELKFIPEISNKKMLMTYKEDKDIANEIYKQATGEIYGQQEFIFDNEFVRDTTKQEIIFSPTPMFNTVFGAISPMWLGGSPKNNIRILIDGGEYNTITPYTIYDYNFTSSGGSNKAVTNNTYPHISHWNKPVNPTFDINFGVCDYYFRSDNYGANTNNNLFNLHWRRTLNQINNGKLLTAYFNLNELDITEMRLSDKIRIDNSWWNINKIQDYDANSTNPTKVELISIDDNLEMPFETRVVAKIDKSDDVLVIPRSINNEHRNDFLSVNLSEFNITKKGVYNYIGPDVTNATILGDSNFVSENTFVVGNNNNINSSDTYVFGSNNISTGGTGNYIFGNNITGSSDNTVYITNLVIPSGGTFNGTTNIDLKTKQDLGTGFITGLTLSINTDNTKFDISAGAFCITDFSDITDIGVNMIELTSPITGITPTYLTTSGINATYVALNSASTVVMQSSPFTNEQRRTLAIIGAVIHSNNININLVNKIVAPIIAPTNQLHDFIKAIGSLNLDGNVFSANGANLSLDKSAGIIWALGIGDNYLDPHTLTLSAQTALTLRYRTSTGIEGANTTVLDPTVFESSPGVLTALANNNRWSIQRVNIFQSGAVRAQYGQTEYTSFSDAIGKMFVESFTEEQNIAENAIFRAYVVLKKNTTDLAGDIAAGDAAIISVDKFGNSIGGPGNAITSAAIIAALGYTPANDANVVHKTGNETVAGLKDFSTAVLKTNSSSIGTSGGGFLLGNFGNPYDRFDFISRDDIDSDAFGAINIQVNPEEGISISQTSIDGTKQSLINMNSDDLILSNLGSGNISSIEPDAVNAGVNIIGTNGKTARLKTGLITGIKTFEFPNTSGTLALLSDITGGSGTEIYVTGGTHSLNTGVSTFTNNTGGTFNVTGHFTPAMDIRVTGGTHTAGTTTFTNSTGGTFNVTGYSTATGTVTAVNSGNGMNFTNITGSGTVTMGTPSSITLASTNSVSTNSHTHVFAPGGTGAQYITGAGALATFPSITDTFVTGGTYSSGTVLFTNNTGGTFNVTGITTSGTSQLELLNEGSGNGWRLFGKNPANYGPIGSNAVDFSESNSTSTTRGATGSGSFACGFWTTASGDYSHAEGGRTIGIGVYSIASGDYSHVEGCDSIASGIGSHAEGVLTTANGNYSHTGGYNTTANTLSETVIGQNSSNITGSTGAFVITEPIFRVGIGPSNIDRKDGYRLYKNGAMYMFPTTAGSVTNGINGLFFYNDTTKRLASHDGTSFKDYALNSQIKPALTLVKANATTTAETVIARFAIPANSIVAGSSIKLDVRFVAGGTATSIWRLRCGANGTIADTLLAQLTTSVAQVANANGRGEFVVEFPTTTSAIGNGNAQMQAAVLGQLTAAPVTATIVPTGIVYLDVTMQLSAANTTTTRGAWATWND